MRIRQIGFQLHAHYVETVPFSLDMAIRNLIDSSHPFFFLA